MECDPTTPARHELAVVGAAGALAGAAWIHLLLTPEHFAEHVVYGVFFLAAAAIQVVLDGGSGASPPAGASAPRSQRAWG